MASDFPLPNGTTIDQGEIVAMTATSYEVKTQAGTTFVPFSKVHGLKPAACLAFG